VIKVTNKFVQRQGSL